MDRLGNYRLRKRLAVGGMGEVYLGEKIGPEGFVKPVVLKCVLPQLAKDRAFVQLFLDEARLAALLNHPNIAQVYDFGLVDDIYYIAMEYVPGYTVDDIRRKLRSIKQPMPLQHIANIASQACQGLHYAHTLSDARGEGLGLVHRDVSPHNLIVSVDGAVKLVDFGIAKARAGLTRVQAKGAVGKFGYMSPEQSRGEVVDGRSDIFSLGICLWELTTNERLHDPNLERAPEYSPARPVRSVDVLRLEVPRQFSQILETALSVEAEDRYPSAREMHLALERFQAAMTHYAGQAALAQFIKELVDGRVGSPEGPGPSSEDRPGAAPAGERRASRPAEGLDAAQKYEEVFGVTMESRRGRPSLKSVPKSWEQKPAGVPTAPLTSRPVSPAPTNPAVNPSSGAKEVDLPVGNTEVLELELDREVTRPRVPRSNPKPMPTSGAAPTGWRPWGLILLLVVMSGLGAGIVLMRTQIFELVGVVDRLVRGEAPAESAAAPLVSECRVTSAPAGATVWLDGESQSRATPLTVELIPDVQYMVEVRHPGHATAARQVVGRIGSEAQQLHFDLEPAGALRITSRPAGARVTVDGRVVSGTTPMLLDDVPAGREVQVRAELEGRPAAVRDVKVAPGEEATVSFELGR